MLSCFRCAAAMTWFVRLWLVGWQSRAPMLWTNSGYRSSVIFSLLAKSRARSKGILQINEVSKAQQSLHARNRRAQTYQTPLRCIGPILTT